MLAKAIAIFALVAGINAGAPISYLAGNPHVGLQSENTVRGFGGLSSVSQYSKAVDSPFSSVRKTDTRVTNDAVHAYAAPVAAVGYHGYAAAPVAAVAHHGYAAAPVAAVAHHGYAAPVAAVAHHGYAAPALAHHYSSAPAVANYHFNGFGLSYAY